METFELTKHISYVYSVLGGDENKINKNMSDLILDCIAGNLHES